MEKRFYSDFNLETLSCPVNPLQMGLLDNKNFSFSGKSCSLFFTRQLCIVMHFLHNLSATSCLHMWLESLSCSCEHTKMYTYINPFNFLLSNRQQNTLVDCYNILLHLSAKGFNDCYCFSINIKYYFVILAWHLFFKNETHKLYLFCDNLF